MDTSLACLCLLFYVCVSYVYTILVLFVAEMTNTFIGKPFGVNKFITLSLISPVIFPYLIWERLRR